MSSVLRTGLRSSVESRGTSETVPIPKRRRIVESDSEYSERCEDSGDSGDSEDGGDWAPDRRWELPNMDDLRRTNKKAYYNFIDVKKRYLGLSLM